MSKNGVSNITFTAWTGRAIQDSYEDDTGIAGEQVVSSYPTLVFWS
jgi:hypothetical protein